jgi:hypothetical protein
MGRVSQRGGRGVEGEAKIKRDGNTEFTEDRTQRAQRKERREKERRKNKEKK